VTNPGSPKTPSTLDALFTRAVEQRGDAPALALDGRVLSYAQLDQATDRALAWLLGAGAMAGSCVALQLDKGLAFVVLHLAAMRLGAVCVPINPRATPAEVQHVLEDSEALLLVTNTEPSSELSCHHERVASDEVFADVAPLGGTRTGAAPDQLACLLFTSGTTGRPKGVRLLHRNLAANVMALRDAWGWTSEDVLLHVLPLFHVHGLFVGLSTALASGAAVHLERRFDPDATWCALARGEVTIFMGVPTLYHRMVTSAIDSATRPAGAVRLFVSGSAPLRAETTRAFDALTGHTILERYGMTEVGMAASNPLNGPRKSGSVGPALPTVELRISDPGSAQPCPAGAIGEVQIRGPSVCDGYWKRPEETSQAFTDDGWFRSGDLGCLDEEGYLQLVGRSKELIISGGFNVYPNEVETALDAHPGVAESAVCGVPDADLGEVVVAGVVRTPDSDVTTEALQGFAREQLAAYKLPRRIAFLDALPRNAMGKLQRSRVAGHPQLRAPPPP
jgi:malonyl-CoA/methylmalonyl-CoA synthetase